MVECSNPNCNQVIPTPRVELWLEIHGKTPDYCIVCADSYTPKTQAFLDYSHKTAPELVIARGSENIRRATRIHNRER